LPPQLSKADLAVFAQGYKTSSLRRGLNWYRNIDRNWKTDRTPVRRLAPSAVHPGPNDAVTRRPIGAIRVKQIERVLPNLTLKLIIDAANDRSKERQPTSTRR
jgi:hypothetical protein